MHPSFSPQSKTNVGITQQNTGEYAKIVALGGWRRLAVGG